MHNIMNKYISFRVCQKGTHFSSLGKTLTFKPELSIILIIPDKYEGSFTGKKEREREIKFLKQLNVAD